MIECVIMTYIHECVVMTFITMRYCNDYYYYECYEMTILIILNLLGICKINWILRVLYQYLFIIFPFYEICVDMSLLFICLFEYFNIGHIYDTRMCAC
jgi:hypothetical protein